MQLIFLKRQGFFKKCYTWSVKFYPIHFCFFLICCRPAGLLNFAKFSRICFGEKIFYIFPFFSTEFKKIPTKRKTYHDLATRAVQDAITSPAGYRSKMYFHQNEIYKLFCLRNTTAQFRYWNKSAYQFEAIYFCGNAWKKITILVQRFMKFISHKQMTTLFL